MTFKGISNTSGRPKGALNKRTGNVLELFERLRCSPLEILARFAMGDVVALEYCTSEQLKNDPSLRNYFIPVDQRIRAASECAQYLAPKRKAVEVSGGITMAGGVMIMPGMLNVDQWSKLAAVDDPAPALLPLKAAEVVES